MALLRLSLAAALCVCNVAFSEANAYYGSDPSPAEASEDLTHDEACGEAYDDEAFDLARLRIDHEYKSEV